MTAILAFFTDDCVYEDVALGAVRGASIMQLEQGRIRRNTDYWSLATLLQQVGVLPPAPSES